MELMDECAGTVILAFERTQIVQALEKRGSKDERQLADLKLPTVWNQIEATVAYSKGHPLNDSFRLPWLASEDFETQIAQTRQILEEGATPP